MLGHRESGLDKTCTSSPELPCTVSTEQSIGPWDIPLERAGRQWIVHSQAAACHLGVRDAAAAKLQLRTPQLFKLLCFSKVGKLS